MFRCNPRQGTVQASKKEGARRFTDLGSALGALLVSAREFLYMCTRQRTRQHQVVRVRTQVVCCYVIYTTRARETNCDCVAGCRVNIALMRVACADTARSVSTGVRVEYRVDRHTEERQSLCQSRTHTCRNTHNRRSHTHM